VQPKWIELRNNPRKFSNTYSSSSDEAECNFSLSERAELQFLSHCTMPLF